MIAGLLITVRESLEAFLVVGILLGYLTRVQQPRLKRHVWAGALLALIASVLIAAGVQALALQFTGTAGEVFEAAVTVLAVGVLTWMVLWMQRQGRAIGAELQQRAAAALSGGQALSLAGLAFFAVLREGVETALFLAALFVMAPDPGMPAGAVLGIAIAGAITYLLVRSAVRLNLRAFFVATGSLLILIAAGLVGHTVLSLQEIGWLSIGTATAWDLGGLIPDDALLGRLLHAFFGYEAAPSVFMVVAYVAYALIVGAIFVRAVRAGYAPVRQADGATSR